MKEKRDPGNELAGLLDDAPLDARLGDDETSADIDPGLDIYGDVPVDDHAVDIDEEKTETDEIAAEPIDKAAMREVNDALESMKRREKELYDDSHDFNTYFVVCFRTRAQKDAFLRATGWGGTESLFLDGRRIASMLGIDIPAHLAVARSRKSARIDRDAATMVLRQDD